MTDNERRQFVAETEKQAQQHRQTKNTEKVVRVYHCYECGWETTNRSASCARHERSELVPMDKIRRGSETIYRRVYAPQ